MAHRLVSAVCCAGFLICGSVQAQESSRFEGGLRGPRAGGGLYDITQEVGTELIASLSGGLRVRLAERWALEAVLRLDRHFTDWTVTDRVSGRTTTLDDYLAQGAHIGIAYRF